jgi:arylsulfatase A-like enzyme
MINRRKFLEKSIKTGLGGCLAFPSMEAFLEDRVLKTPGPPQARGHRPDIIFLMTDQQRWDALGSLNSHIRTPHLDRLAKKGVIFRNATCQSPSCVPGRNSMMFGLYPSQLGILSNGSHSLGDSFLPCDPLPARLQKVGYQTAGFGKTHWGRTDELKSTRGFEIWVVGAKEVGLEIEEPEFETIYALGGLNEVGLRDSP